LSDLENNPLKNRKTKATNISKPLDIRANLWYTELNVKTESSRFDSSTQRTGGWCELAEWQIEVVPEQRE
jgi:hypothetical protein